MEYKPQELTLKGVFEAVTKAMAENRLGAQNPKFAHGCYYDYGAPQGKHIGCAIGVCLTPETLAKAHQMNMNGASVSNMVDHNLVTLPQIASHGLLCGLQNSHDDWVGDPANQHRKARFLKTLEQIGKAIIPV